MNRMNHSKISMAFLIIILVGIFFIAYYEDHKSYKTNYSNLERHEINSINYTDKIIDDLHSSKKYTDFPYCYSQAGCYVENGLYVIIYAFSTDNIYLFRCYDSMTNTYIWEKHIKAHGHANAVCFRTSDRRLYIADGGADGKELNTVSVVDYDDIDKGIIETIVSPARGSIIGLGYDRTSDTFYSTNYKGGTEGEANVLFSYNGIFDSVKNEVKLDDYCARYKPCHYCQGLQCVSNGIAYILYFGPNNIVAGFDVNTGELRAGCCIPEMIDDYKIVELESLMYNHEKDIYYLVDARGIIEIDFTINEFGEEAIDKDHLEVAGTRFISNIPFRWILCACYIEDQKYVVCHVAEDGFGLIMRCFDKSKSEIIWTQFIEGSIYANSICFRPKDRRLYLANSYTYANENEINNSILVFDFDNVEKGAIEEILSPARGGIYSIAYDSVNDTFYSTNYKGSSEGNSNVLFSYNGIFESVAEEIMLDDFTVGNKPSYSSMGVQCIKGDTAYYLYDTPNNIIAGYDLNSGEFKFAYNVPEYTADEWWIGKPESIIFNQDDGNMYLQTYVGMASFE